MTGLSAGIYIFSLRCGDILWIMGSSLYQHTSVICVSFIVLLHAVLQTTLIRGEAVTEGDVGYNYGDYSEAYEELDEDESSGAEPSFDVPILNVTVVAGQSAVLPCSIENLGKHKVIWTDSETTTLTYDSSRIIDDMRFDVIRPFTREWNLQIRDVQWKDQGQYRCTINTHPVKKKVVTLHVKVPAKIIDHLSSNDITVDEGDTVVLWCNVTGVPRPEVTWFRRPANSQQSDRELIGLDKLGEVIVIENVTRYCDDYYQCVANNGVPSADSREMRVTVQFPPEVSVRNERIGQELGRLTILECKVIAYPHATNNWLKDGRPLKPEHRVNVFTEIDNRVILSLQITNIQPDDYGEYTCHASNELGSASAVSVLYEYRPLPTHHASKTAPPLVVPITRDTPHDPKTSRSNPDYQTSKGNAHQQPDFAGSDNARKSVQEQRNGASHYTISHLSWVVLFVTSEALFANT